MAAPRVGLIARADKTGLGIQTWCFWRNMKPDVTLVVDLHHCSGQRPDLGLYAGDPNVMVWQSDHYPNPHPKYDATLQQFLDRVDVVFTCETAYNPWLFARARQMGVRTVLQPNYEFMEALLHPELPEPDVYALPSLWHLAEIKAKLPNRKLCYLPVPVDRELLPFRQRTELTTLLHTAGTPAMEDRNGTLTLIEAMHHVQRPVKARIRTQKALGTPMIAANTVIDGSRVANFWDLYGDEDLFVMPRKFGGLCLPMQEAMSVGMPTLMSDTSPQSSILPEDLRVEVRGVKQVMTRAMIVVHEMDPRRLAQRIDWLYDNPDQVARLSTQADEWATANSWEAHRAAYDAVLEGSWP